MPTRPVALAQRLLPLSCVAAARTIERRDHLPHALPHRTSRRCCCRRVTVSLSPAAAPCCASSPPGRCARGVGPPLPCHLWHYGTWATPTLSTGHTGCASRIAPGCTRQLPTTSSLPPVLSFLLCPPLCARPPLFSSSHRGHGELGRRHLPSISCAHVCALMSACQPSPPRLESSHDEVQFGSCNTSVLSML